MGRECPCGRDTLLMGTADCPGCNPPPVPICRDCGSDIGDTRKAEQHFTAEWTCADCLQLAECEDCGHHNETVVFRWSTDDPREAGTPCLCDECYTAALERQAGAT